MLRAWAASQPRESVPHPATCPGDGLHRQPPSLWQARGQGFQTWALEPSAPSTKTSSFATLRVLSCPGALGFTDPSFVPGTAPHALLEELV